ncbi:MAG: transcription repressor NadR [Thermovirgaceae bacterium]
MERFERLKKLVKLLETADGPKSGSELAEAFFVSRQAVVQDIALLRKQGVPIAATPQGYVLQEGPERFRRIFAVRHEPGDIAEELGSIVNAGGHVLDVIVDHPIYGEIRGNIHVKTREDVTRFVNLLNSTGQSPLLSLSRGFHLHTVEADNENVLDDVERILEEKGFLVN